MILNSRTGHHHKSIYKFFISGRKFVFGNTFNKSNFFWILITGNIITEIHISINISNCAFYVKNSFSNTTRQSEIIRKQFPRFFLNLEPFYTYSCHFFKQFKICGNNQVLLYSVWYSFSSFYCFKYVISDGLSH